MLLIFYFLSMFVVVTGSATSLEESRESTPSANAVTKKYESDIEILSNPSQSSIEVLDETQRLVTYKCLGLISFLIHCLQHNNK